MADSSQDDSLLDALKSLTGNQGRRKPSGSFAPVADPTPIDPERRVGVRSVSDDSDGIAGPLVEIDYSEEFYSLISSDGLFTIEIPKWIDYQDAKGRVVRIVNAPVRP